MRTAPLAALLLLAAAAAPASEEPPPPPPKPWDIAPLLEPLRRRHDLPALAAAILVGEEITAIGTVGVRERGRPEKAGVDDLWHLGSCTKSMTATLCAVLVEEGTLAFDRTVTGGLGELAAGADPAWKGCTLEMLLRHRAGASPAVPPDLWEAAWNHRGPPRAARRDLVAAFLPTPPLFRPGTRYAYSNMNYVLAGAMAEEAADGDWETLLRERLFAPLGMKGAGFGAPGTKEAHDQPRGHRKDGTPVPPGPAADNPPSIGPAGTVHAPLRDWARFVALHLEADLGRPRLLEAETFTRLHSPPAGEREGYAMGWMVTRRPWSKGPVLSHLGSNTFWTSLALVAPAEGFAVIVCCNRGGGAGEDGCDATAWSLARAHLGL